MLLLFIKRKYYTSFLSEIFQYLTLKRSAFAFRRFTRKPIQNCLKRFANVEFVWTIFPKCRNKTKRKGEQLSTRLAATDGKIILFHSGISNCSCSFTLTFIYFTCFCLWVSCMIRDLEILWSFNMFCIVFMLCVTCLVNKLLQYNTISNTVKQGF